MDDLDDLMGGVGDSDGFNNKDELGHTLDEHDFFNNDRREELPAKKKKKGKKDEDDDPLAFLQRAK